MQEFNKTMTNMNRTMNEGDMWSSFAKANNPNMNMTMTNMGANDNSLTMN